jgi:hypothetical protein
MAEVAGKGGSVAEEKNLPYHVIQTHIILNDWPGHFILPISAVKLREEPYDAGQTHIIFPTGQVTDLLIYRQRSFFPSLLYLQPGWKVVSELEIKLCHSFNLPR